MGPGFYDWNSDAKLLAILSFKRIGRLEILHSNISSFSLGRFFPKISGFIVIFLMFFMILIFFFGRVIDFFFILDFEF